RQVSRPMIPTENHLTTPDNTPCDRLEVALALAFGRQSDDFSGATLLPSAGRLSFGAVRAAGRYELLGEIARGGRGVILRARAGELGRDLAVKVLHEGHRGNPAVVRRFLEEARISGQLQHPGVVPIHEVGRSPDGCPFFVMKLIQGRTLADLLAHRA